MLNQYKEVAGKASVTNAGASAELMAAPGAGKKIRLVGGIVNVTVAATGGGGVVSIKDGSTVIASYPASAIGSYVISFGSENGYPMTANTAINVVAESAITNQASANVAAVGYIAG